MKNALIVLCWALGQWLDRCLIEIISDLPADDSLPPRDVPESGWSSETGDLRIKRVVGSILFGLVVVLVIAQVRCRFHR